MSRRMSTFSSCVQRSVWLFPPEHFQYSWRDQEREENSLVQSSTDSLGSRTGTSRSFTHFCGNCFIISGWKFLRYFTRRWNWITWRKYSICEASPTQLSLLNFPGRREKFNKFNRVSCCFLENLWCLERTSSVTEWSESSFTSV